MTSESWVTGQAFKRPGHIGGTASLCVLPGWAKLTTEFMLSQSLGPNVMFPHTVPSTLCARHAPVNQSSETNIYSTLVASTTQRPPTTLTLIGALVVTHAMLRRLINCRFLLFIIITSVSHATTSCCQFNHKLIIGYGNSNIGCEIISVSHPY